MLINEKEKREMQAKKHTEQMASKYPGMIREAVNNTKVYGIGYTFGATDRGTPDFRVVNKDTVTAAFSAMGKVAILNFASYLNPGGNFIGGSMAQEEALCHESFLYNVLVKQERYYDWNRQNRNRSLYLDRALYTPDVVFEHAGRARRFDVLTCAAPNIGAAAANGIGPIQNGVALKSRILFIRDIFEENKAETVILGAFGCGVFGQDPKEVAEIFRSIFKETAVKHVVFAVPAGKNKQNFAAFKEVFG